MLSNVFPPGFLGGYELGALEVAQGLAARGHDVKVLTSNYFLDDAGELIDLEVERSLQWSAFQHPRHTHELTQRESLYINWQNLRKLGSALRRHRPDLVIIFNAAGLGPVSLFQYLRACDVPTLAYFMDNMFQAIEHDSPDWAKYQRVFGPLDSHVVGKMISMSRNLMREMDQYVGGAEKLASYVPGWVDFSVIDRAGAQPSIPSPDSRAFVFCSRIAGHKGIGLVAEAARQLLDRGVSNFTIDVYGAGQVTQFLQQVALMGLEDHVRYCGLVAKNDMIVKYADYDALLFPTWEREPFGFVATEAAAMGCVPVMTAAIGAAEWFLDGADSIKISRSAYSLAAAMENLVAMSPSALYELKLASAATARRNLGMERWMNVIARTCDEIATAGRPIDVERTRKVESAFLALNETWFE